MLPFLLFEGGLIVPRPKHLPFHSVDFVAEKWTLSRPLDNSFMTILEYLKSCHDPKSIIIEEDYIDKDFSNELSNVYSKTYRCRRGYCTRLHFFKEQFRDADDFAEKFMSNKPMTYLGYLVQRPLSVGKVGRTLILPGKIDSIYYLVPER